MTTDFDRAMQSYWDHSHWTRNAAALTGATLAEHLSFLRVSLPHPSGIVLCVGVGTGGWVEEVVFGTDLSVWALDVSLAAKVPACVPKVLSPELLPTGWFDLAMSHWVSPHVDEAGMSRQLSGVIRSLTPRGTFAVHYNEPAPDRQASDDPIHLGKAGEMTLTRERFLWMVNEASGEATVVAGTPCPEYKMTMVVAHCRHRGANDSHE